MAHVLQHSQGVRPVSGFSPQCKDLALCSEGVRCVQTHLTSFNKRHTAFPGSGHAPIWEGRDQTQCTQYVGEPFSLGWPRKRCSMFLFDVNQ